MTTIKIEERQRSISYLQKNSTPLQIVINIDEQWKHSSKIRTSPSAIIGKSSKITPTKQINNTGPGSYDLEKHSSGFSPFLESKPLRTKTDSPGPSYYKPKYMFPSKKFSFCRSQSQNRIQLKPSPCTYNPDSVEKAHGVIFTKRKRDPIVSKDKESIPGPGKYQSSESKGHKNQFSFLRSSKFLESSMESSSKQKIPGPGAYDLTVSRMSLKNGKFAKAMRKMMESDKVPGPGSYKVERSLLSRQGGSISREKRLFNYETNVPGPGNYKDVPIDSIKKKESVATINKAEDFIEDEFLPGPGAYMRENSFKSIKITGGVIGKEKKTEKLITSPSPVSYSPSYKEIQSKATTVAIGKARKSQQQASETPGPGYYQIDRKSSKKGQGNHNELIADLTQMNITVKSGFRHISRDRSLVNTSLSYM